MQEAARVKFFCVFSVVLLDHDVQCVWWLLRSMHAMLNYEGPASLVNLFFTHASPTVFDQKFGIRLEALEMCYILVPSVYPPGLVENESYELT